jgi:hypothetical protein
MNINLCEYEYVEDPIASTAKSVPKDAPKVA